METIDARPGPILSIPARNVEIGSTVETSARATTASQPCHPKARSIEPVASPATVKVKAAPQHTSVASTSGATRRLTVSAARM